MPATNPIKVSVAQQLTNLLGLYNPSIFDDTLPEVDKLRALLDIARTTEYIYYLVQQADREAAYQELDEILSAPESPKSKKREVEIREGQERFRRDIKQRYFSREEPVCAVTGESAEIPYLVHATHIKPYCEDKDNHASNGILLRTDIHTLWDSFQLGFEPIRDSDGKVREYQVVLSPSLKQQISKAKDLSKADQRSISPYLALEGRKLYFGSAGFLPKQEEMLVRWQKFQNAQKKYRRNPLPVLESVSNGLKITTTVGCYTLIAHPENIHEYIPYHPTSNKCSKTSNLPSYQYIFPLNALADADELGELVMFNIFNRLFMGDPQLVPMLDKKRFKVAPYQYKAIFGNGLPVDSESYKPGFVGSLQAGKRRGLLLLPTGLGKTVTAALCYRWLVENWDKFSKNPERKPRLLFIAHQTALVTAAEKTFKEFTQFSSTAVVHSGFGRHINGAKITDLSKIGDKLEAIQGVFITDETLANILTDPNYAPRNKERLFDAFDLVIIDEAHHTSSPPVEADKTNSDLRVYAKILQLIKPRVFLLGMTATPYSSTYGVFDGNVIYSLSLTSKIATTDIMSSLYLGINKGYLAWIEYKQIQDIDDESVSAETPKNAKQASIKATLKKAINVKPSLEDIFMQIAFWSGVPTNPSLWEECRGYVGNALTKQQIEKALVTYTKKVKRPFSDFRKTMIFCAGIEEAARLTRYLVNKGVRAKFWVHQPPEKYEDLHIESLEEFQNEQVLCVVGKADEGIDLPHISVIIFYTYTNSRTKILQRIGRGLRLSPGKRVVHVIDLLSNYPTLMEALQYGIGPQLDWSKRGARTLYLECAVCETRSNRTAQQCLTCGADLRTQNEDAPIMNIECNFSLETKELFGRYQGLQLPSQITNQMRALRQEQGATLDEILALIDVKKYTQKINDKEIVSFPGFPYAYSLRDFLLALENAKIPLTAEWSYITNIFVDAIPEDVTIRGLYQYCKATECPGMFVTQKGKIYYQCECGNRIIEGPATWDQSARNCTVCDKIYDFWLSCIYPQSLDKRLILLESYVTEEKVAAAATKRRRGRSREAEYLGKCRELCGLGFFASIDDQTFMEYLWSYGLTELFVLYKQTVRRF